MKRFYIIGFLILMSFDTLSQISFKYWIIPTTLPVRRFESAPGSIPSCGEATPGAASPTLHLREGLPAELILPAAS